VTYDAWKATDTIGDDAEAGIYCARHQRMNHRLDGCDACGEEAAEAAADWDRIADLEAERVNELMATEPIRRRTA
jgi:hypothetical protein